MCGGREFGKALSELVYQFYHARPRKEGGGWRWTGYTRLVLSKEPDTPASGRECIPPIQIFKGRGCGFCFSRQVRLGRRLQPQTVRESEAESCSIFSREWFEIRQRDWHGCSQEERRRALRLISLTTTCMGSWVNDPLTSQGAKRRQQPFKSDICPIKRGAAAVFYTDGPAKCEIHLFNLQNRFELFHSETHGQHFWRQLLMGTKLASKPPNKLLEQKGSTEKVVFLNGDEIFTWIEVEKMWGLQKMKGQAWYHIRNSTETRPVRVCSQLGHPRIMLTQLTSQFLVPYI